MTVMLGYYLKLDWLPDNSDLFVIAVGGLLIVGAVANYAVRRCA